MSSIFDALPGLETPVGAISKNLALLWSKDPLLSVKPGEDSKATQVNFVLHLGIHTTPEDALAQFGTAVRFSRRYPCRVVVLCPVRDESTCDDGLRAKIYGECHPGKTRGDLRCCEFVILSYPSSARRFLENQVSICLSTDLPLYYWAHNFSSSARLGSYHYLLSRSKRVLLDRATVSEDDPGALPWPKPEVVRDLSHARLLPVRQTIGQFLSAVPAAALADGLRAIIVRHGESRRAEAGILADWSLTRLAACGAAPRLPAMCEPLGAGSPDTIEVEFQYNNVQHFRFVGDFAQGCAQLSAHYQGARLELSAAIGLLSPEAALAEAMFF